MNELDSYIIAHHRSMSAQEIADKTGVNKSTVTRHVKTLRDSGMLDDKDAEAARAMSEEQRERLKSCSMTRADRLEALHHLEARLMDEIELSGGSGLARVSSEYRKVLEEIEALSAELKTVTEQGRAIDPSDLMGLWKRARGDFEGGDAKIAEEAAEAVLEYLDAKGYARTTPVDRMLTKVRALDKNRSGDAIDKLYGIEAG